MATIELTYRKLLRSGQVARQVCLLDQWGYNKAHRAEFLAILRQSQAAGLVADFAAWANFAVQPFSRPAEYDS
jgi:hypothetical protein